MDTNLKELVVWFVLSSVVAIVKGAGITSFNLDTSPAVVGSTSRHAIRCIFSFNPDTEQFYTLKLLDGSDQELAWIFGTTVPLANADWTTTGDPRQRSVLSGSFLSRFLLVDVNTTLCMDSERKYKCMLDWKPNDGVLTSEVQELTVIVEAAPRAPSPMVTSLTTTNVTEGTQMTFTCTGNVGRPAGTFQWFTFSSSDATSKTDVTNQATEGQGQPGSGDDSCTFLRTSTLTLNASRTEAGTRLVVRCRVDHPTQGNDNDMACQDPDTDHCRMSQEYDVQYPVSVSVGSDTVMANEGTDQVLYCNTQANPPPVSIEWHKEGENGTLETGYTLTLTQVTLNDTGRYICTASNILEGSVHQASDIVSVTVRKTTTPPPTTTPVATTPGSTSGGGNQGGQTNNAGADGDTIIIIIVVVVVVVVIAAVVILVIIIRRRRVRKEVEEPPEKPFNNNAGINTLATRPDLVSNDKAYAAFDNPYKNEDGLTYAELQFDNKPRSRRPLAIDDSRTDYSDVSMPQV